MRLATRFRLASSLESACLRKSRSAFFASSGRLSKMICAANRAPTPVTSLQCSKRAREPFWVLLFKTLQQVDPKFSRNRSWRAFAARCALYLFLPPGRSRPRKSPNAKTPPPRAPHRQPAPPRPSVIAEVRRTAVSSGSFPSNPWLRTRRTASAQCSCRVTKRFWARLSTRPSSSTGCISKLISARLSACLVSY